MIAAVKKMSQVNPGWLTDIIYPFDALSKKASKNDTICVNATQRDAFKFSRQSSDAECGKTNFLHSFFIQ